ncbi:MAG TPA: ABC transporter permease subunit [Mycobacteriales bacterium]|nr:ABC transporter permease subunit [Mycobacteriales bacterium]
MSAVETAPSYVSRVPARTGFPQLLHAEWTKFRTVRAWVTTTLVATLVLIGLSWFAANGSHAGFCSGPPPGSCHGEPPLPVGPDGEAVVDTYFFVHQPLTGDGSITARVTALTGRISTEGNAVRAGTNPFTESRPGLAEWAKAGLLLRPSLRTGSQYAAVLATGSHGVRMQSDYVHDTAGLAGAVSATSPRWLRLTRVGDVITGADSADGVHWTTVTTARLHDLPSTVQVGLFVTSPAQPRGFAADGEPTYATGHFDNVAVSAAGASGSAWVGGDLGGGPSYRTFARGSFQQAAGGFTVSGSGDIAPAVRGAGAGGQPAAAGLVGAFAALIVVAVLGALFMTSEYRRGLLRTTFAATPRRGRVLAAKALVLGAVTFVGGVVGAVIATAVSRRVLLANGNALFPMSGLTEARVAIGLGAVVAVTAVLALAVAAITRRSTDAVVAVIVTTVVPYILSMTLSGSVGTWLLRLTPAAGFAVEESLTRYHQVANSYSAVNGYYPLSPLAGFAVLCAWTLLALVVARRLLRRRDA